MNTNIKIILFILFLIFIINVCLSRDNKETFNESNINMYVISLKHQDRLDNIQKQKDKINKDINIFEAVRGDFIDFSNIKNEYSIGGRFTELTQSIKHTDKRVLGCYLSHLNLLKKIKQENQSGYTVIFEDDFNIISNNFIESIYNILNNIAKQKNTFDMIFLGNTYSNKGDNIIENIYDIDVNTNLYGTHAYLINNKNIDKIINNINHIDEPIDVRYEYLGKNKILDIYVVYPVVVNIINSSSTIQDLSIETFYTTPT